MENLRQWYIKIASLVADAAEYISASADESTNAF
jgi:hypothetical protein